MVLPFYPGQEVFVKQTFYGSTVIRWALVTLRISYVYLSDPLRGSGVYVCSPVSRSFVGVRPELTRIRLRCNIFIAKKLKYAAKNKGREFN